MPNTSKVDRKRPKKSKEAAETPVTSEKKAKEGKTPKDEAQRAEKEQSPSKKKEKTSPEKKRKKGAEGDWSAPEFGSLAKGPKESSRPAKKSHNPEETTLKHPNTASGPDNKKSASKDTLAPSRSSKSVDAHEAHVPKQKKRSRGEDEPAALTSTIAKRLKLNDGGAVAASSKVKGPSREKGKYSNKEEEEIMLEDSSDEEVEGEDHIHGFSTDTDSSDGDAMVDKAPALDVSQLPTVAKDDAAVQKRLQKAKSKPTVDRGVLYIGRIPHGFYEDQMKEYFSQFGNVTRLRMARNKKTGQSKHYGFIEFDSSSVAQIVSETMDNYLIMGHLLQCKVIPKGEVHPDLWVGANRRWRKVPVNRVARVSHNKPRTEEQRARAEKKLLKRQEERIQRLKDHGIEYSFGRAAYTPVGA